MTPFENNIDIVVLMAGNGSRFENSEYKTLKPLINIKGKTILEWTLSSLPREELEKQFITFAIRTEHDNQYNLVNFVSSLYPFTDYKMFSHLTRGNLDTAHSTISSQAYIGEKPILFLDSDNLHSSQHFFEFIKKIKHEFFAATCYFEPIDDSSKWCFAQIDEATGRVKDIKEKDPTALAKGYKPIIGVFYFSSVNMFRKLAKKILNTKDPVNGEFYMSQVFQEYLDNEIPVFAYKAETMIPLGTPEDVSIFAKT